MSDKKKPFDFLRGRVSNPRNSEKLKASVAELDQISAECKEFVDSGNYIHVKDLFYSQLAVSIDELIEYEEKDAVVYKQEVREILIRIKILKDFLGKVEARASKAKQPKGGKKK